MARPNSRSLEPPPKDEWGVYDPQQAGLAALYARLEAQVNRAGVPPGAVVKTELTDPATGQSSFRNE